MFFSLENVRKFVELSDFSVDLYFFLQSEHAYDGVLVDAVRR